VALIYQRLMFFLWFRKRYKPLVREGEWADVGD
jgi:hypothetical protein